jgi:hypothetical protein
MPNTVSTIDLPFIPIPDSRAETSSGETATITVLPDGSYSVGSPSAQTLTIVEDDSVQIPANGWKLTQITAVAGSVGALAINTVPDGFGDWRGQVAGYPRATTSGEAFFWNSGSLVQSRYWPSAFNLNDDVWSEAHSLNDAGTIVGASGYWNANGGSSIYFQQACLWPPSQTYPTLLQQLSGSSLENRATDINNRDSLQNTGGIIIGSLLNSSLKMHAVAWIPDSSGNYTAAPTQLGDVASGDKHSYAAAINDWADYVGKSQISSGNNYHAFRAVDSNSDDLPDDLSPSHDMGTDTGQESHSSEGKDINNFSEMVGASQMNSGQYRAGYKSPFTGKNQGWFDLGVLGAGTANAGNQSIAYGINDNGLIVGRSMLKISGVNQWRAFVCSNQGNPGSQPMLNLVEQSWVWTGSIFQRADLNGWTFTRAEKVNNANWIVAYGVKNGTTYAVVLSPL